MKAGPEVEEYDRGGDVEMHAEGRESLGKKTLENPGRSSKKEPLVGC